jgi:hypothetical protein
MAANGDREKSVFDTIVAVAIDPVFQDASFML